MEISILLGRQIISMFLIVLVGFFLTRSGLFSEKDTDTAARLNMFVICPCAIFNSMQREFSMDRLTGLLVALLAAVLVHILFLAVERILRRPLHLTPVESASIIYSNALNLILPLVIATLGDDMVFYVSAYVILQTFLLWTHCVMLISGQRRFQLRSVLNPNLAAIVLGLIFYLCRLSLPSLLSVSVTNIGSMLGPMSMLIIGMLIGPQNLKVCFCNRRAYRICFLRLVLLPVLTVLLLRFCGIMNLHREAADILMVTTIAAASCSAATVPQQAQVFSSREGEASYASMLNVMTLVFCIVTMPLILLLYQVLL